MADELTPRYSMKRMRDEIARAKEYARREALEEAAKVAENEGKICDEDYPGETWIAGQIAAAIRSLSVAKEPDHD